nr:hypothetical protein [Tanacetum cinerariifolium]
GRKNGEADDLSGEEVVLDTTTGEHEEQIIEDVSTAEPVTTAGEVVTTIADKTWVIHQLKPIKHPLLVNHLLLDPEETKAYGKQRKEAKVSHAESEDEDHVLTSSSDPLPSGEDSYTLNELMVFCTSLQEKVFDLQEVKDA